MDVRLRLVTLWAQGEGLLPECKRWQRSAAANADVMKTQRFAIIGQTGCAICHPFVRRATPELRSGTGNSHDYSGFF
jgi:hypothetical protein